MSTSSTVLSFDELKDRVLKKQARGGNNPDNASDIKDPHDAGTKSVPSDPAMSSKVKSVPEDGKNSTDADYDSMTTKEKTESGDGKSPSVAKKEDKGNGKDVCKMASELLDKINFNKKNEKSAEEHKSAEEKASKLNFSEDTYIKLAQAILSDEENYKTADRILKRQMGAEAAQELLKNAAAAAEHQEMEKQATQFIDYIEKHASVEEKRQFIGAVALEEFTKNASKEEAESFIKLAESYQKGITKYASQPHLKRAFDMGAQDAALAMDAGPEAMGAQELTPEDLIALILLAAEQGDIPPEIAEQLVMEIQAAMGGEASAEAPVPMEGEAAPAPEEMMEQKAASLVKKYATK